MTRRGRVGRAATAALLPSSTVIHLNSVGKSVGTEKLEFAKLAVVVWVSMLVVKKGDTAFDLRVYGFPVDEIKAKEKTLAADILGKL